MSSLFSNRAGTRAAWGLLVLVACWAAFDLWQLRRVQGVNALIQATTAGAVAETAPGMDDAHTPPPLRFAQAYAQAASGAEEAALNRYGALHGSSEIGRAARYNSANLLLRQALALHAGAQQGQALALVELAKEGLREVLRQDPGDWNARYNLERAQRLVPEPEAGDGAPPEVKRDAERAPTTMRGFSPGLP
jgi:mxaK protein